MSDAKLSTSEIEPTWLVERHSFKENELFVYLLLFTQINEDVSTEALITQKTLILGSTENCYCPMAYRVFFNRRQCVHLMVD